MEDIHEGGASPGEEPKPKRRQPIKVAEGQNQHKESQGPHAGETASPKEEDEVRFLEENGHFMVTKQGKQAFINTSMKPDHPVGMQEVAEMLSDPFLMEMDIKNIDGMKNKWHKIIITFHGSQIREQ
ncbi:unnamed protein product, partial [Allacma fusca]